MSQKIKITQTSNADMNIGVHKNCHISTNNSDTKQITMAQQTAVEWLQDKLNNVKPTQFCSIETIKEWVEQAKQMEKEQIIKAFSSGQETPINHPTLPHYSREEYYNETFVK